MVQGRAVNVNKGFVELGEGGWETKIGERERVRGFPDRAKEPRLSHPAGDNVWLAKCRFGREAKSRMDLRKGKCQL